MNHARNTVEWQPGDQVLHDDDGKRPDMLMEVLGRIKSGPKKGLYRTRYVNTDGCAERGPMHEYRRKIWTNPVHLLHDPARFGVKVEQRSDAVQKNFQLASAWWNGLTELERADWLKRAQSTVVYDAWALFKTGVLR